LGHLPSQAALFSFRASESARFVSASTNPTHALLALDGWLTALEDGLHVTRRPIFFGWDDVNSLAGALQGIVANLVIHADDGQGRFGLPGKRKIEVTRKDFPF